MSAADQINELRGLRNAGGGIVRNNNELIQRGLEHAYPRISKDERLKSATGKLRSANLILL